ncbi:hypothetical protein [uncultured Victivallis sp.]|uniref:hypothetical protein n=1 Tax=uncultured Victivallis sp. TaxID=354118 RepID=UPI0025E51E78|nr:hypothetical protein [uncultured Victivallis sp.]
MLLTERLRICLVSLLCFGPICSAIANSEVVLTLDRDYFNPFALGVKYDLLFKGVEDDARWDVTCIIQDNRTRQIHETVTFRNMSFKRRKGFYFFMNTNRNSYTTTICIVGDKNGEQNNSIVNGGLESHYMNLPLRLVVPVEEERYLFSVRPSSAEQRMATVPKGFTRSILGGNGTQKVDWSIFLKFQKIKKVKK